MRSTSVMPIPCKTVDEFHQVKRNVFCRNYGSCLDHTIEQKWEGFSCEACRGYERERLDREQLDEDHSRCLTLIYFVLFKNLRLQVCHASPSFATRNSIPY